MKNPLKKMNKKNRKISLAISCALIIGFGVSCIMTLESCNKETVSNGAINNSSNQKGIAEEFISFNIGDIIDRETMDAIYDEVAYFHGYEIAECTLNKELLQLDEKTYLSYILQKTRSDVESLELPLLNQHLGENYISLNEALSLYNYNPTESTILSNYDFNQVVKNNFNLDVITAGTNQLMDILIDALEKSETEEEFYALYRNRINELTNEISNPNDFFCAYISAAVCMNSFMTWSWYFYNDCSTKKDRPSVWQRIKDKAQEITKKLEPYVEADLEGAAWGALVGSGCGAIRGAVAGSAAGGVGAIPGAVAGAVSGAVNGSFEGAIGGSLIHHHKNHKK